MKKFWKAIIQLLENVGNEILERNEGDLEEINRTCGTTKFF